MDESARFEQWNHTSEMLAMIANTARDAEQKSEPFLPSDFHPFIDPEDQTPIENVDDPVALLERIGL